MKSMIQSIFVLMTLTLLAGCNSEGAFNSEPQPPVDAKVVEITVTPSPISVLKGRTQQLVAMAKYDDESEKDVSNSVIWEIVGDPTVARVSASGLLTGNTKGETELTASKDGIISNTVNVNVCDLAGACIDIFDTGTGKLFTNSPSKPYLDSIGGSDTDGTYNNSGNYGPAGVFYMFNVDQAKTLCSNYNSKSIGGRTNWRLTTREELHELYDSYGNMTDERGWPTGTTYFSSTLLYGNLYYSVDLEDGTEITYDHLSWPRYASCVSEPVTF